MKKFRPIVHAIALCSTFLVFAACNEKKTPAEEMKENVKDALDIRENEEMKDAAEEIADAGEEVGDAVKDAAKDIEKAAQEAAE